MEKINKKNLKEKFVQNKEKFESQKLEQKNLKILLKEMKSSEERKYEENIVKEVSLINCLIKHIKALIVTRIFDKLS